MARKKYGRTVWGADFMAKSQKYFTENILSDSHHNSNVNRLISHANIDIGEISAYSRDSFIPTISFFEFEKQDIDNLIKIFEDNPLFLHRIITGVVPDELLQKMNELHVPLFSGLNMSCSCNNKISMELLSDDAKVVFLNVIHKNFKLADKYHEQFELVKVPKDFAKALRLKSSPLLKYSNVIFDDEYNLVEIDKHCTHLGTLTFKTTELFDREPLLVFKAHGLDLIQHFNLNLDLDIPMPFSLDFIKGKKNFNINKEINIIQLKDYKKFILSLLDENPKFAKINYKAVLQEFYGKLKYSLSQIIYPLHREDIGKIKRVMSQADIEFVFLKSNHFGTFKVHSELFEDDLELVKSFKDFGYPFYDRLGFTTGFQISPVNMFLLFLSFDEDLGSEAYRYLYYLFRVSYMLIESGGFVPAVLPMTTQYKIIYRPLTTIPEIRQEIDILSGLMPKMALYTTKYLSQKSGTELMLISVFTEFVVKMDFKHKRMPNRPPEVTYAFFRGQKITDKVFNEPKYKAQDIYHYLSIFETSSRNYKYQLDIVYRDTLYGVSMSVISKNTEIKYKMSEIQTLEDKLEIYKFLSLLNNHIKGVDEILKHDEALLNSKSMKILLFETIEQLANLDVSISMPKELRNVIKPKLSLHVKKKSQGNASTFLDLATLLSYDWQISIGDEVITSEEFEKMVKTGEQIVQFRDQFVLISYDEVQKMFDQMQNNKKLTSIDMLRAKWSENIEMSSELKVSIEQILSPKEITPPVNLQANLRNYQLRGFQWATTNLLNGFGVILADDMGLGKTVQTITIILYLKQIGELENGVLIVVPTSLLNNWERELQKFAPSLSFYTYYGNKRESSNNNKDIVFTTYNLLIRDIDKLNALNFNAVVIDEAQKIKNPDTATTLAVKSLKSKFKIALSGTPVENNLSELWSIFDFTIPTYLKSLPEFRNDYADAIELHLNKDRLESLRKITSPFMLRRLKIDKQIISDLPDKIVIDEFASLTKEQASLYQSSINETFKKIERAVTKSEVKGAILQLITSLKQICNHPRNFDRESHASSSLSGKSQLLMTLLETILERGEQVLIFSQYTEMIGILESIIEKELSIKPLLLTGDMSKTDRDHVVELFTNGGNQYPIFLLSLKAGGVGLNLTSANHVIHYDLWFNPAVENQATDRAFRIGQNKNVTVHRLITKGTFEEKIDRMIKSKEELSNLSLSTGESWLSNLAEDDIRELFDLNQS